MILCYQVGRETITGLDHLRIPPLATIRELNETMANIRQPSRVIGISMNSSLLNDEQADAERERVQEEMQLPVCDVIRHGADDLVDAILGFRTNEDWHCVSGQAT